MRLRDGKHHVITFANGKLYVDGIRVQEDVVLEFKVADELNDDTLHVSVVDGIGAGDKFGPGK